MIELTQIKLTDTVKMLRGQLNTAFSEIQNDQMVVGKAMGVSVNLYSHLDNSTLVGAITASNVLGDLWLLCLPENNGVYVAGAFGTVSNPDPVTVTGEANSFEIDIASVLLPNRGVAVNTFIPPEHMGFTQSTENTTFLGNGVNYEFWTLENSSPGVIKPQTGLALVAVQTASHLGIKPVQTVPSL